MGARYVHASIPIEQGYGNRVLTFTVGTSRDVKLHIVVACLQ